MKTLVIVLFISLSAYSQQKVDFNQFYPIDRSHSFIEFSIQYMGYAKMKGRFADFSGLVFYDDKNVQNLSVSLGIKTESIDTDNDFRDNDLKSDNWFDAKQYPLIAFSSKSVKKTTDGFEVIGDLTIKGVMKEVVLKMNPPSGILKDVRQDHQIIFTGSTTLDRTQYGVEGKNWSAVKEGITAVGNEVSIDISILCKQTKVANWSNRVKNPESSTGKIYKSITEQGIAQGVETYKSLKAAGPVDRNVLSTVGYMLVLEGKMKDAITLYEMNREAYPQAAEVYYDLGEAYGLSGDLNKSKSFLQEAVKIKPDYFWAVEALRHF